MDETKQSAQDADANIQPENKSYIFTKHNVSLKEYKIHKYVYDLGIVNVPRIYDYNKETQVLKMQKINNMCISDFYGEDPTKIPEEIFEKIRNIIHVLCDNNIEYKDITGYNFIEHNEKLWIIDFEHASFNTKIRNKFIRGFLKGNNKWNPEFI